MMTTSAELQGTIDTVSKAMSEHIRACADGEPVPTIVARGEEMVRAMLEYERLLGETYGWSNPIRHLGPPLDESTPSTGRSDRAGRSGLAARAVVTITQQVTILDAEAFPRQVQARFGDVDSLDLLSAAKKVAVSEAWVPSLGDGMHTRSTEIDVTFDRSE